jgi:hypothetical protein
MPVTELVSREVTAKFASLSTRSSRRSARTVRRPYPGMMSFCHEYMRCRVRKRDCPNPASESLSSLLCAAVNALVQNAANRLRLAIE